MRLNEFAIGGHFTHLRSTYRCTDIGTRTVAAICVDDYAPDYPGLVGPPYAALEIVIDEDMQQRCTPAK